MTTPSTLRTVGRLHAEDTTIDWLTEIIKSTAQQPTFGLNSRDTGSYISHSATHIFQTQLLPSPIWNKRGDIRRIFFRKLLPEQQKDILQLMKPKLLRGILQGYRTIIRAAMISCNRGKEKILPHNSCLSESKCCSTTTLETSVYATKVNRVQVKEQM